MSKNMKAVTFLHQRIADQREYIHKTFERYDLGNDRAAELITSAQEVLKNLERMLIPSVFVKDFEPFITW